MASKLWMLQLWWNITKMLTVICRWAFWHWNLFEMAAFYMLDMEKEKNVKHFKKFNYSEFTERCIALWAFTIWYFLIGCRLVAIGEVDICFYSDPNISISFSHLIPEVLIGVVVIRVIQCFDHHLIVVVICFWSCGNQLATRCIHILDLNSHICRVFFRSCCN